MASKKTAVIEYLFYRHWDKDAQRLRRTVMTFEDVRSAIVEVYKNNKTALSADNVANFMKDFARKHTASKNWPASIGALRYTADQRVGDGAIFEFVEFGPGQTEPFPDVFLPSATTQRCELQSLSLSYPARQFGRRDETWLIQTAVQLHLIETHLALFSEHRLTDVSHLQLGVKLRRAEIDALFLGHRLLSGARSPVLITCEAKQLGERLTKPQIVQQVAAAFDTSPSCDFVIPTAMRVLPDGIYVVEFRGVDRSSLPDFREPVFSTGAIYSLKPPVSGIP